jgi:hypothetical protein
MGNVPSQKRGTKNQYQTKDYVGGLSHRTQRDGHYVHMTIMLERRLVLKDPVLPVTWKTESRGTGIAAVAITAKAGLDPAGL